MRGWWVWWHLLWCGRRVRRCSSRIARARDAAPPLAVRVGCGAAPRNTAPGVAETRSTAPGVVAPVRGVCGGGSLRIARGSCRFASLRGAVVAWRRLLVVRAGVVAALRYHLGS